jgi:hypothetical protein
VIQYKKIIFYTYARQTQKISSYFLDYRGRFRSFKPGRLSCPAFLKILAEMAEFSNLSRISCGFWFLKRYLDPSPRLITVLRMLKK